MKLRLLTAAIGTLLLSGCSISPNKQPEIAKIETNKASNVPNWVLNPTSANGLAASNCVSFSGSFSIDRNHAVSLARNTLAQNLDVKISVLEKNYQRIDGTSDGQTSGSSFEQVAKQVSNTAVSKSQVEKVDLVEIDGDKQVCALVVIPTIESERVFGNAVPDSSDIQSTERAELYKEFMTQKTTAELEAQAKQL